MATWYFRPVSGAPYGAADGTSYADAWGSTGAIVWASITATDMLIIAGDHNSPQDTGLIIPTTVSSIRITGNVPEEPGTLGRLYATNVYASASSFASAAEATLDGANVYVQSVGGNPLWALENDGSGGFMTQATDMTCSATAPAWHLTAGTFYYKPVSSPQDVHTMGTGISASAVNGITIEDLRFQNGFRACRFYDSSAITIRGCVGAYHGQQTIVFVNSHNLRIASCSIHDTSEPIQVMISLSTDVLTSIEIEANVLHDLYGHDTDQHGIGINHAIDVLISGNTITSADGTGMTFFQASADVSGDMADFIVRNNTLRDIRKRTRNVGISTSVWAQPGRGIEFTGGNAGRPAGELLNCKVVGNKITSCSVMGIYAKTQKGTSAGPSLWIENNHIKSCGEGIRWGVRDLGSTVSAGAGDQGCVMKNNVLQSCTRFMTQNLGVGTASQMTNASAIILSGNVYQGGGDWMWCDKSRGVGSCTAAGGSVPAAGYCVLPTFATWQAYTGMDGDGSATTSAALLYMDNELSAGGSYSYAITAVDSADNEGASTSVESHYAAHATSVSLSISTGHCQRIPADTATGVSAFTLSFWHRPKAQARGYIFEARQSGWNAQALGVFQTAGIYTAFINYPLIGLTTQTAINATVGTVSTGGPWNHFLMHGAQSQNSIRVRMNGGAVKSALGFGSALQFNDLDRLSLLARGFNTIDPAQGEFAEIQLFTTAFTISTAVGLARFYTTAGPVLRSTSGSVAGVHPLIYRGHSMMADRNAGGSADQGWNDGIERGNLTTGVWSVSGSVGDVV